MIYGYARVSTPKQFRHGNSLEEQREQLKLAGAQEIVSDSYTGTRMDRPAFSQLLSRLQPGDKLIVTKLDRFARTAVEGGAIVKALHERGVCIHILNMGIADNTPMGRLMVTMLLAFAEFERDMIVERTQSGKAIARANGKRVDGRPRKYTDEQIQAALTIVRTGCSYADAARRTGISKSTIYRAGKAAQQQKT